ncbi:hypothetical protein SDRG_02325 [Saprolegnia diclina VS20]|uniref:Glucosidase 2 subunit beta n=1 Tax=Saprolegnia diclina (strain VS20) TaxID=1156394 RepID=T0QQP0_SAPDV|nr:hypothetical protein SDRG_02325 [Saprolegnia diclina VS20]EQC40429.1 hypothetical protein SDRG_02325 [Saprolegnia diclina VS20]|eukprot:XP_008606128.1 hypothetical protein SDRG_02325 [Saprolegnia diclina VS20]
MVSTRLVSVLAMAAIAMAAQDACISAVSGDLLPLVPELMNDDFCDCADGRDEPHTAACSHVLSAAHDCHNRGLLPMRIHTSQVGDGVCDCCDGSDEAVGVCVDACDAEIDAKRAAVQAHRDVVLQGFAERQTRLNALAQAAIAKEHEILAKKALKEELRQLRLKVTVFKDREERTEYAMRIESAKQKTGQCAADSTTNDDNDSDVIEDEAPVADSAAEAADTTVALKHADAKSKLSLVVQRLDGRQTTLAAYMHEVLDQAKRIPMRSVYQRQKEDFLGPLFNGNAADRARFITYGLQGIGLLLSPVRGVYEVLTLATSTWFRLLNVVTPHALLDPWHGFVQLLDLDWRYHKSLFLRRLSQGRLFWWRYYASYVLSTVWDAPVDVIWETFFPTLDRSVVLPEAESLRSILTDLETDMQAIDQEIDRLERVFTEESGPDAGYQILKGVCAVAQFEKYHYTICPFGEATQDSVRLGSWKRWSSTSPPIMSFEDGEKCWNGPHRSVQLVLECGSKDQILSVDELSTCVYTIKFATPAACTSDLVAQVNNDAATWL